MSVPPYLTRAATHDDAAFLYDSYKLSMYDYIEQTWGWDENFQRSSFAEHLPWQRFQIIMVDGVAIGGACTRETSSGIELEMMFILPAFRRMGIGADFVETLVRHARERAGEISLVVLKVNPARRFYERLGFSVIKEDANTLDMRAGPER